MLILFVLDLKIHYWIYLVAPGTNLSHHMDNEKAFVWSAMDYADEEPKAEMFCIRFGTVESMFAWIILKFIDLMYLK